MDREAGMQAKSSPLHEMWLEDSTCLSGTSVHRFVSRIVDHFGIRWVRVSDIAGAGILELTEHAGKTITSSEFVSLVGHPSQYDWAFFLMYVVEPSTDLEPNDKENILTADITVRLVDDGYFYVYTANDEMALQVRNWYPHAKYSLVEFQSLIIPY